MYGLWPAHFCPAPSTAALLAAPHCPEDSTGDAVAEGHIAIMQLFVRTGAPAPLFSSPLLDPSTLLAPAT